jgi:hypothetical protein
MLMLLMLLQQKNLIEVNFWNFGTFDVDNNHEVITRANISGLPFGFLKGQINLIWPVLKQFSRNEMIWPLCLFWS